MRTKRRVPPPRRRIGGGIGHLRLPRDAAEASLALPETTAAPEPRPAAPSARRRGAPDPILLFFPARDEQATVADVVRRAPQTVLGHPVRCLVVDDGSADRTPEVAAAAGADVASLPHRGFGAAVRRGLAEAVRAEAVAVAFCDADGEYAPEELERLVGPILAGDADYVVGSRFAGDISRMAPHRRLGNLVLTRLLGLIARRRITDGQSGFRALSPAAAAAAEIIHDFNYAQVLTLDLLSKGFRYAEVPITYRSRTTGRSFVRLGSYLRAVLPAIYRELNSPSIDSVLDRGGLEPAQRRGSVLDDVGSEAPARVGPGGPVEPAAGPEGTGGSPGHRQSVVGVVVDEQALPAEREQV